VILFTHSISRLLRQAGYGHCCIIPSRCHTAKAKGKLYGMRVQNVKMYGSENWVMNVKDTQCLEREIMVSGFLKAHRHNIGSKARNTLTEFESVNVHKSTLTTGRNWPW
jgi:hypothetical protein